MVKVDWYKKDNRQGLYISALEQLHRDEMYLAIAALLALRGTCMRGKVGAVIVRDKRIISTGYNGSVVNAKHCMERGCDVSQKCTHAVHAEENAIAFAAKQGIRLDGAQIYCTHAPCYDCAKLIVQVGITEFHYMYDYGGGSEGLILLDNSNIITSKNICQGSESASQ